VPAAAAGAAAANNASVVAAAAVSAVDQPIAVAVAGQRDVAFLDVAAVAAAAAGWSIAAAVHRIVAFLDVAAVAVAAAAAGWSIAAAGQRSVAFLDVAAVAAAAAGWSIAAAGQHAFPDMAAAAAAAAAAAGYDGRRGFPARYQRSWESAGCLGCMAKGQRQRRQAGVVQGQDVSVCGSCVGRHRNRVGQTSLYTLYMIVFFVISLPNLKIPYAHRMYLCIWLWPTLHKRQTQSVKNYVGVRGGGGGGGVYN